MFGFLIGIVSLVLLVKVAKGHGPFGRRGSFRHGGGGRRFLLRRLYQKLDATPAQEKALREALDELWDETRTAKGEWKRTRDDIVSALRDDDFDPETMTATFARQDSVIEDTRRVFLGSLAKVHATLDPEQREQLATFLARRGGPSEPHAGPYRTAEV